jgi:ankyrin repeat protein
VTNYKANINHGDNLQKPIIAAIKKGDLELVKFLVDKGADIQIDGNCDTTIITAESFNQAAITKYLIEKSLADNKTFSTKVIMEIGRKSQNQEILNLFNSKTNIDPNELAQAISQGNLHKIEYLVLMQGADINMLDSALTPMFSLAILSQNKAIINFFFKQKAHVNPLHEKVSMTPLEATAVLATKNTAIEIIDSIFAITWLKPLLYKNYRLPVKDTC